MVETKIVEIDVSPKNILIREYSGLLDELELDEDALDDSDDDYGGYAQHRATRGKDGGGGRRRRFGIRQHSGRSAKPRQQSACS